MRKRIKYAFADVFNVLAGLFVIALSFVLVAFASAKNWNSLAQDLTLLCVFGAIISKIFNLVLNR